MTTAAPLPALRLRRRSAGMSTGRKVLLGVGGSILAAILLRLIFGSGGKNDAFKPQNEFKLDPWISIHIGPLDMSINKAVLYLFLASAFTIGSSCTSPSACSSPESAADGGRADYSLMKDNIAGGNMDRKTATKWFTFMGALFLFIWFSNILGYLPLPTNTEHKVDIFGAQMPSFALYAATANISVTLALTLVVWSSTTSRASGQRASSAT